MHEEESGVNKISFQNAAEAEYTVYPESFTKKIFTDFANLGALANIF